MRTKPLFSCLTHHERMARLDFVLAECQDAMKQNGWLSDKPMTYEEVSNHMSILEHLNKSTVDPISLRVNFKPDSAWPMRKVNLDKGIK